MSFNGAWPDDLADADSRQRLGFAPSDFVVGHFAPTRPSKGTYQVLELARTIRDDRVRVAIFGECHDASLARAIHDAARDAPGRLKVHLGPLRDEELQVWFKACDVVAEPYLEVTTAGSIYFPIAFRRPVIATPRGNIPDVIQHRVTGWLASGPEEIRECVLEALEDPEAARAMGERAHAFVDRTAGIRDVADAYVAAYRRALER